MLVYDGQAKPSLNNHDQALKYDKGQAWEYAVCTNQNSWHRFGKCKKEACSSLIWAVEN